jgi:hypothetical protein
MSRSDKRVQGDRFSGGGIQLEIFQIPKNFTAIIVGRGLAPAVANLPKTNGYIPDVTKITETLNLTVTVNGVSKNYKLIYSK